MTAAFGKAADLFTEITFWCIAIVIAFGPLTFWLTGAIAFRVAALVGIGFAILLQIRTLDTVLRSNTGGSQ